MEYFELTKSRLENAKTYMPLGTKKVLAENIARACIKPMKQVRWNGIHIVPAEDWDADKDPTSLPDLMEEDVALKMALLQNVFLSYYFDIEMDPDADAYDQYDYYAGGHLMNQLKRFESDRDVKNTAFDVMEDFREFKKMVDTIIYNHKQNANDPLKRFDAMLTVFSTPENIRALVDELGKAGETVREDMGLPAEDTAREAVVLKPIPEA